MCVEAHTLIGPDLLAAPHLRFVDAGTGQERKIGKAVAPNKA